MKGITTCLWFDDQAEDAAKLYASIFPNSSIGKAARYDEAGAQASGRPKGSVMTVPFTLDGHAFLGLNGGPVFNFSESVSFVINCESQAEIDRYWEQLTAGGGQGVQCGWLKDRFGISWQVVPARIGELMQDPAKSGKAMKAVLGMKKIDLAALERAVV